MMKKLYILVVGLLVAMNSSATSLKLVETEHEKGDRDNPPLTTYSYQSAVPLTVEYSYGYDSDHDENNLGILFSEQDIRQTYLGHTRFLVSDDSKRLQKSLRLPNKALKHGCFYNGKAEIQLDEVYVVRNDITTSSYGGIFIKNIKPLNAIKVKCNEY
ncbi:hypothetical protein [Acinetobacter rongchengensis]|uniref:Uncharacterized protein n=1 Tax=Acinetobacter rongchengensis TaxID=2419601 RepID=A0A3A8F189_9GAMM|nr:hypothetical protein [Acinetobacter rongchengensis]RKG40852.1 hypothetical protein D7V20_00215 [Acinetobacter rongchengensis]